VSEKCNNFEPQIRTDLVSGAANRFPDKCDADPEGAQKLNVEATHHLAQATSSQSILLIYISTDYVFPGVPGEAPYEADAFPSPPNLYGQTKLDGERVVLDTTKSTGLGIVLRVPVLYGKAEEPKESAINVLMDVVWKAQEVKAENAKISMDHWAQRYPTNTEDVGRVCKDVAAKYLEAGDARSEMPRTLQFSSEDRYTKYEICELFAEIMGLPIEDKIEADRPGNGPKASVQRPYDTHLSSQTLKDLGINVQTQNFKAWWYAHGYDRSVFHVPADGISGNGRYGLSENKQCRGLRPIRLQIRFVEACLDDSQGPFYTKIVLHLYYRDIGAVVQTNHT